MLLWRSSCSCSDIFYDDLVFFSFSKLSIPRSPSLRACQIWQSAHVTVNCPCIFVSELKVFLIIIRLELVRPRLGSLPQTRSSSSRCLESPKTRPKGRRFVNCSSLQRQRARLFGFLYLRAGASLRVLCFISRFISLVRNIFAHTRQRSAIIVNVSVIIFRTCFALALVGGFTWSMQMASLQKLKV